MAKVDGKTPWRRRIVLAILALFTGAIVLPIAPRHPAAEDLKDLTLLFNGSVQGKIAPCG